VVNCWRVGVVPFNFRLVLLVGPSCRGLSAEVEANEGSTGKYHLCTSVFRLKRVWGEDSGEVAVVVQGWIVVPATSWVEPSL